MTTIEDQIAQAKIDLDQVYNKGKQSEYDRFWDALQENDADDIDYNYKFYYWRNGEAYNPKYTIHTNKSSCNMTFYGAVGITDTMVDIDVSQGPTKINNMFQWATKLHTVRKLIVSENITSYALTFHNCDLLKNIEIEGVIASDIAFPNSPYLTEKSLKSITDALKPTTTAKTLTLHSTAKAKITADTNWYKEVTITKGWTLA